MEKGGFENVTPFPEARETLESLCSFHGRTERQRVTDADGQVLAEELRARRNVPHYRRAAMDGYAVRAADTYDADERSPVALDSAVDRVESGTACRVHTGDSIPEGADAVVKQERVIDNGDAVLVHEAVPEGGNVATAGEDVAAGETIFGPGRRLRPSDLALLRATGHQVVETRISPQVAVIPTGEELVDPGDEPEPGEVVETNGLTVATLVKRWGGSPVYRDVVTDDRKAIEAAIQRNCKCDIVVTTGGSSVGERDLVPDAVSALGELSVHGVRIKPGHPVGIGRVDGVPVLSLPGYPVSCLVTAVQFLWPAVAWRTGTDPPPIPTVTARLDEKVPSAPGERTFARVQLGRDGNGDDSKPPDATPVRVGGAGVLSSVTTADGWVVVSERREGIPADESVTVQRWEWNA